MTNAERLGKILREARLRQGRTLADVAGDMEFSQVYLSHVERGKRPIVPEVLQRLSASLVLDDAKYQRAFRLLGRLPPDVERHFLSHPEHWPSRVPR